MLRLMLKRCIDNFNPLSLFIIHKLTTMHRTTILKKKQKAFELRKGQAATNETTDSYN